MSEAAKNAIDAWKQADLAARGVEAQVAECWDKYFKQQGPSPSEALLRQASELRSVANQKLTVALVATGSVQAKPRLP